MIDHIDAIDKVTYAVRKIGALLRAADADGIRERDHSWLLDMALEATEEADAAVDQLNGTHRLAKPCG